MNSKEVRRREAFEQVKRGEITLAAAVEQLQIGYRHGKRLYKAYKEQGDVALVSKRRGRRSNNATAVEIQEQVKELVKERYSDFTATLAMENLEKRHGIILSREKIRQLMIEAGVYVPKKKRKEIVHQRRPRREQYGELVQLDGSHHHWFEDRAAPCVLLAAIDDATSNIVAARFEIGETTNGYFRLVEQHFNKHGFPTAYYSDKFGVFRVNQGNDRSKKTQFKVAMDAVKVHTICADSPQAKGRIERLFGTLQDRLVKEMRLRGISSVEEANLFLPSYIEEHNKQFGRSPKNPSDAHRPLNHDLDLRRILCKKDSRKVSKNLEISWFNRVLQIQPNGRVNRLRGARVDVLETPDGEILLEYLGEPLEFVEFVEGVAQPAVVGAKDLATLNTG